MPPALGILSLARPVVPAPHADVRRGAPASMAPGRNTPVFGAAAGTPRPPQNILFSGAAAPEQAAAERGSRWRLKSRSPMRRENSTGPEGRRLRLAKGLLALLWLAIIAACLLHKDEFTLEGILTYTPRQPVLAALLLLLLFAAKSLSIFLYSGLLYAASGILFPLPAAILVNLAGTAVMVSIPYWLGKKLGSQAIQYILHRWPKSAMLHDLRSGSDFFFVLIVRLLGILSADVVSAYMGAVGVRCREYLPACLLGFLTTCVLFPIMGMSISDPGSPQFLIAAGIELAAMLTSCIVFHFYRKKHRNPDPNRANRKDE